MTYPQKRISVAVIIDDSHNILIDQRPPHDSMGGYWEFPGGKIEEGETPEDCVIREIKEELGVDIVIDSHLMDINHNYPEFTLTLMVFKCHIIAGNPQPLESVEVRWVTPSELTNFQFPEANQAIIDLLQN
ncbi:MAG: 8-oxo-dGTP diphosphatase MutT [Cyanobacterium sp. T60_A2020_053]|nr:8-oxo-dGTP diphosphatase MutT [Cyanobacterium sp. T60_A2020_053]